MNAHPALRDFSFMKTLSKSEILGGLSFPPYWKFIDNKIITDDILIEIYANFVRDLIQEEITIRLYKSTFPSVTQIIRRNLRANSVSL